MARTAPQVERTANLLVGALILYWMGRGGIAISGAWRDAMFDALKPLGAAGQFIHQGLPWAAVLSVIAAGLLVWRPANLWILWGQLLCAMGWAVFLIVMAPSLLTSAFGGLLRLLVVGVILAALVEARRPRPRITVMDWRLRIGLAGWLMVAGTVGCLFPADGELQLAMGLGFEGSMARFAVQGFAVLELVAAGLLFIARPGGAAQTVVCWTGMTAFSLVPVMVMLLQPAAFWQPTTPFMVGFCPMAVLGAIGLGERHSTLRHGRDLENVLVRSRRLRALARGQEAPLLRISEGIIQAIHDDGQVAPCAGRISEGCCGALSRIVPVIAARLTPIASRNLQADLEWALRGMPTDGIKGLSLRSLSRRLATELAARDQ